MKPQEENKLNDFCFTDFDGKFHARLAAVIPRFFGGAEETKLSGTSARYQCRIKVEKRSSTRTQQAFEYGAIFAHVIPPSPRQARNVMPYQDYNSSIFITEKIKEGQRQLFSVEQNHSQRRKR